MKRKNEALRQLIPDLHEADEEVIKLREQQDELKRKFCEKCGKELHGEQSWKETFAEMEDDEFISMMDIRPEKLGELSHTCGECLKNQPSMNCATDEHWRCDGCRCKCHAKVLDPEPASVSKTESEPYSDAKTRGA